MVATLVLAHPLGNGVAQFEGNALHVVTATQHKTVEVVGLANYALSDETAVAVTEQKHGQIVLRLELGANVNLVVGVVGKHFAIFKAQTVLLGGKSVTTVVRCHNNVAVLVQMLCKLIVAFGVLCHAVANFYHTFGAGNVVPNVERNAFAIESCKCGLFHC